MPIYKSSKYQFWPILANIAELPKIAPMIVAIYYGETKPPSADEYFHEFVEELEAILRIGIQI